MIDLIEVYFKNNNEKQSFFGNDIIEKDGVVTIKHGQKETMISRADIKYYTVEKQKKA